MEKAGPEFDVGRPYLGVVPAVGRRTCGWLAVEGVAPYEAGYPRLVLRRGWLLYASVCRHLACVALLYIPMVGGDLLAYRELETEMRDRDDGPEPADRG